MNRREWLTRVFGAAVAAGLAPLVDLTDATPAFWNQPAIRELMPWKIKFPDGNTFSFAAQVLSERLEPDGSVSFTVRPDGPMQAGYEAPAEKAVYLDDENGGAAAGIAQGTLLQAGERRGTLTDLELPRVSQDTIEVGDGHVVLGVLRRDDFTFRGRFE